MEGMKKLPDNSIDLIATDPPYGIGFMGKKWDKFETKKPTKSQTVGWMSPGMKTDTRGMIEFFTPIWKEALRVLKPGAFAFVMCIPRQDCLSRMIISLEDAGFNVNFSSIYHVFAQGFPKSLNIEKSLTKKFNKLREGLDDWIPQRNKEVLCNLRNANIVEERFKKNQIEVGINIEKRDFVVVNVAGIGSVKIRQLLNVIIAE